MSHGLFASDRTTCDPTLGSRHNGVRYPLHFLPRYRSRSALNLTLHSNTFQVRNPAVRTVIIPEAQISHKRPLHQKCISYAEIHRLQQLRCPRQIRRIRIPKLYDHECCFRCHAPHGRICRGSPFPAAIPSTAVPCPVTSRDGTRANRSSGVEDASASLICCRVYTDPRAYPIGGFPESSDPIKLQFGLSRPVRRNQDAHSPRLNQCMQAAPHSQTDP